MMQQVAASKPNIASPAINQERENDNRKERGREFGAIFQQQSSEKSTRETSSAAEHASSSNVEEKASFDNRGSDKAKETERHSEQEPSGKNKSASEKEEHDCKDCKDHGKTVDEGQVDNDNEPENGDLLALLKGIKETDIKHHKTPDPKVGPIEGDPGEKIPVVVPDSGEVVGEVKNKEKSNAEVKTSAVSEKEEHDCKDCKDHGKTVDEGQVDNDNEPENGDLLALLKGIKETDIKHHKTPDPKVGPIEGDPGEKIPVVVPDSGEVVGEVKNKEKSNAEVKTSAVSEKVVSEKALTEKSLLPVDIQSEVDKLSSDLNLTAEQKKTLQSLLQQIHQSGKGQVTLEKADVKLVADLMQGDDVKLQQLLNKESADGNLNTLLSLSDKQADKVINHLSSLMSHLKGKEGSDVNTQKFVDSLKAGLAEIKSQLQQGHEPGISLKDLLQQAMGDVTDNKSELVVKPELLKQTLQKTMLIADVVSKEQNQLQSAAGLSDRTASIESQHVRTETVRNTSQGLETSQAQRPVNITRPEGHQQLADKVRMMVNTKNLNADIRLDPPDLGSMQIKITMQGDQASVSFVVQSQQAQQTLEQSAPRLREMLAERGIELGQSSVQQEGSGKQADKDGEQKYAGDGTQDENAESESGDAQEMNTRVVNGSVGGIDYFA